MEEINTEERQRWWLLCYGITSMRKVIETCDLIVALCPDNRHPLFQPLSVAVHVYYSRPFKACRFSPKDRRGNKLKAAIVPSAAKAMHEFLVDIRDSTMGHIDASSNKAAKRPMNDVIYTISEGRPRYSTGCPLHTIQEYSDAREHAVLMIRVFGVHIRDLESRFSHIIPSDFGDFTLVPEGDGAVFVKAEAFPTRSTITYGSE